MSDGFVILAVVSVLCGTILRAISIIMDDKKVKARLREVTEQTVALGFRMTAIEERERRLKQEAQDLRDLAEKTFSRVHEVLTRVQVLEENQIPILKTVDEVKKQMSQNSLAATIGGLPGMTGRMR